MRRIENSELVSQHDKLVLGNAMVSHVFFAMLAIRKTLQCKRCNKRLVLTLLTVVLVFAVGPTCSADTNEELVAALQSLQESDYTCTCSLSNSATGKDVEAAGGTNRLVAFEGELEIHVKANGAISSASPAQLPRIMIYQEGKKHLYNQMHKGLAVDCKRVADLLSIALGSNSLAESLNGSDVESKEVEGGKKYRVTLEGQHFHSDGHTNIAEATLLANVDTKGSLAGLALRLTHTTTGDPQHTVLKFVFDSAVSARTAKAFASRAKGLLK